MKGQFRAGFIVAAALAFASPAQSGVIVDTFGAGNTFDPEIAYTVGNSFGDRIAAATPFMLSSNGIINDIAVAAYSAENFMLTIVGNGAGAPDVSNVIAIVSGGFTVDGYIEFDPFIALTAGTYWLVMSTEDPVAHGGWYMPCEDWTSCKNWSDPDPDNLDQYGTVLQSDTNGEDWTFGHSNLLLPAYRIGVADVSEVPEPGTLTLFGAGLLGIGVLRRRMASRRLGREG